MRWKLFVEFCLTILIVFVVAGDILLPQPYRSESQQLKTNINQFLVGLIPNQTLFIKIRSKEEKSLEL